MRVKFTILALLFTVAANGNTTPGYHFQIDFSGESSDNISGWTTNRRPDHPKGGVQVVSGLYARFRNGVAAMKSNAAFTYAGTLSFVLRKDTYGTNNPGFKVYTSTDGGDWENGWVEVFATSYDEFDESGNQFSIDINSGTTAVYIKLESVNDDDGSSGTQYSFQLDDLELTDNTPIPADNVEVGAFLSSCLTVSSETLQFTEVEDNVFLAHDSIAFDADCQLSCLPLSPNARIEELEYANPFPGSSDTAVYRITSEDETKTVEVKAIIARSLYQSKFGFLTEISNTTTEFDGWTFGGNRYPSSSKGNGGAYPGEKAMRIYESGGSVTTPKLSSISTLSFVAKFSNTDGESLKVQKSYDGSDFNDIIIYTPEDGPIPAYDGESSSDPLSGTITLDINERNVFIRFQYVNGNSDNPRTMIDDIACKSMFDPDETFTVNIQVKDFFNNVLEGALVKLANKEVRSNSSGEAAFMDIGYQMEPLSYSVSLSDYLTREGSLSVKSNINKTIYLTQKELDIYLALGQSNMAGRADIEEHTENIDGAWLLNDKDVWVPAANPMNVYSNIRKDIGMQNLGPSYSFTKTIGKYIDKRICIICNARGGTSVTAFARGGEYHHPLMERISKANDFGTVKGIIWHQGESNSGNYTSYLSILNTLVEDIRDVVSNDSYFLAGQLGPWDGKYEGFNENLTKIQSHIDFADYVHNSRIEHLGDKTHFNTPSQLLLGNRYAQKMLEEIYDIEIGVYEFSFSNDLVVTNGSDTIRAGDRVMYTALWNDGLTFKVHCNNGMAFDTLSINGSGHRFDDGTVSFEFPASSRDSVFNIEAAFKETAPSHAAATASSTLNFYPNPASETITFTGGNGYYEASVYGISGKEIIKMNGAEMNLRSVNAGYYILLLQSGDEKVSKTLIKYRN